MAKGISFQLYANIPKGFWFYEVDSQLLFALRVACFAWEYTFGWVVVVTTAWEKFWL